LIIKVNSHTTDCYTKVDGSKAIVYNPWNNLNFEVKSVKIGDIMDEFYYGHWIESCEIKWIWLLEEKSINKCNINITCHSDYKSSVTVVYVLKNRKFCDTYKNKSLFLKFLLQN